MALSPIGRLISTVSSHTHLPFPIEAVFTSTLQPQRPPLLSHFNHIFCRLTEASPGSPFFTLLLLYHAASCRPPLSPSPLSLSLSSTLLSRSYITPALLISPPIIAFCSPVSHYVHSQSPVSGSPFSTSLLPKAHLSNPGFRLAWMDTPCNQVRLNRLEGGC